MTTREADPQPEQLQDPQDLGPKPPYPKQAQPFPGADSRLRPQADHGEQSYRGSGKLAGRAALVTGADSGIGRAIAIAYAREGADVLISFFNERDDAEETRRWVEEAGRKAVVMGGDLRDELHCQALVARAVEELGRLDILVNNAAYQMTYPDITKVTTDEFDRTFRTNVYAMFWLCKAALPHLPPGSAIINTSSIEAYQPEANLLPYAATKGAIVTFSKGLAQMVIKQGIRVNVVAPGPVWTPLIAMSMPEDAVSTFGQSTPIGRPAQPAELAPLYVYLASNDSSYVTGMVYGVTGGLTMI